MYVVNLSSMKIFNLDKKCAISYLIVILLGRNINFSNCARK